MKRKVINNKSLLKEKGKVIAITGSHTFAGKSIINELLQNSNWRKIVVLDIQKPPLSDKKISYYDIDLTQPEISMEISQIFKNENVDSVLHSAFLWNVVKDIEWAHEVESIGTMHLLNACKDANIRKLIITSTTAVYGASFKNPAFIKEEFPFEGAYIRWIKEKIDCENQIRKFREINPEMIITVLRTCHILGQEISNTFTRHISRKFVPVVMGYDPLFQFLHEKDAKRAFLLAIEKDFSGEYNIAGEGVLPLSKVLSIGKRIPIPLPLPLISKIFNLLYSLQIIDTSSEFLDFFKFSYIADIKKAKEEMGFFPEYSSENVVKYFYGV